MSACSIAIARHDGVEVHGRPVQQRERIRDAEEMRKPLLEPIGVVDGRRQMDGERDHQDGEDAVRGLITTLRREDRRQKHALDGAE